MGEYQVHHKVHVFKVEVTGGFYGVQVCRKHLLYSVQLEPVGKRICSFSGSVLDVEALWGACPQQVHPSPLHSVTNDRCCLTPWSFADKLQDCDFYIIDAVMASLREMSCHSHERVTILNVVEMVTHSICYPQ